MKHSSLLVSRLIAVALSCSLTPTFGLDFTATTPATSLSTPSTLRGGGGARLLWLPEHTPPPSDPIATWPPTDNVEAEVPSYNVAGLKRVDFEIGDNYIEETSTAVYEKISNGNKYRGVAKTSEQVTEVRFSAGEGNRYYKRMVLTAYEPGTSYPENGIIAMVGMFPSRRIYVEPPFEHEWEEEGKHEWEGYSADDEFTLRIEDHSAVVNLYWNNYLLHSFQNKAFGKLYASIWLYDVGASVHGLAYRNETASSPKEILFTSRYNIIENPSHSFRKTMSDMSYGTYAHTTEPVTMVYFSPCERAKKKRVLLTKTPPGDQYPKPYPLESDIVAMIGLFEYGRIYVEPPFEDEWQGNLELQKEWYEYSAADDFSLYVDKEASVVKFYWNDELKHEFQNPGNQDLYASIWLWNYDAAVSVRAFQSDRPWN